jgi:geranylgeranyl diphosphate synthase type I
MKAIAPVEIVEQGVDQFANSLRAETVDEHPYVQAAIDGYMHILQSGGKRTRGVLAVYGYELFEGEDTPTITVAAGAIEALHAYLLVVDDVADNALTRRGQPAAHIATETFLQQEKVAGNTKQIAEDLAIAAALTAQHHAQSLFTGLEISADRRLTTITNINRHLARTGMGQILDIASSTGMPMNEHDILNVAVRKTAHYSFQLPLETGALLAGGDPQALNPLARYARHAGIAFQLQDDLLGTFGDQEIMGKSPKSDLCEGKQTFLVHHALTNATPDQQVKLQQSLGNREMSDIDFAICQQIIVETGARAVVENRAACEVASAQAALDSCPPEWSPEIIKRLREMASYTIDRSV